MSSFDKGNTADIVNSLNLILFFIAFALFELLKRKACKQIYNVKTMNWLQPLITVLIQLPTITIFWIIPTIISSFKMLNDNIITKVTSKRSLKS